MKIAVNVYIFGLIALSIYSIIILDTQSAWGCLQAALLISILEKLEK